MDPNHPLPGAYWKALKLFEAAGFIGDVDLLKAAAKDLDSEGRVEEVLYGYRDIANQTVLHFASFGGKTDVCKYLIEEVKLDVNARDANGDDEMLHLLLSEGANVDPLSLIGSPLQMAASKANEKAVKILLDNGSNPDLFFPHVETPLVASILAKSLCCLEHLIKAGANPIALSGSVAPLGVAASEGEVEMVQCLLEAGAIPDVTDKYGLTAMELAALKGNQRIVQILYPVTSKISTYPDWSIHGIMKDASSELARKKGL